MEDIMRKMYVPIIICLWMLIIASEIAMAVEATCTVDEVRRFSNRVHVRCLERYWNPVTNDYSIKYFAAPTSNPGRSQRLEDLGNQTNINTTNTIIESIIYFTSFLINIQLHLFWSFYPQHHQSVLNNLPYTVSK